MNSRKYTGRAKMETFLKSQISNLFSEDIFFQPFELSLTNEPTIIESLMLKNISSDASYMIKFMPDYFIVNKKNFDSYFIELKFSRAPLLDFRRLKLINELEKSSKRYHSTNVGVIAREAFYAYRKYFPHAIIFYATPYNKKILMAQFVKQIRPIYVSGLKYYENGKLIITDNRKFLDFHIATDNYFELDYNPYSTGSKTQHVNIDLDSFYSFEDFFKRLNMDFDLNKLKEVKKAILAEGINLDRAYNMDRSKDYFKKLGYPWKI